MARTDDEQYRREVTEIFGANLAKARQRAGLSFAEVASRADMSVNAYRMYEAGIREPKLRKMVHLAQAVEVDSINELVQGIDE